MKCLVTGATGYIGSSLVQRLSTENHRIVGLIHKRKPEKRIKNVEYVTGDISDRQKIMDIAKEIDVVFHCAGIVSDFRKRKEYYRVHVNGTKNLVESCKKYNIKRFIFLSHIPYESNRKKHPYQKSKAIAEAYLLSEFKENQFPAVIIRPGNVYGPGATTWLLRPLTAIMNNKIALINNGNGIFHHTYIDNLLDALLLAMITENIDGEIFEITDGDNTVTWKRYFNDLSGIVNQPLITQSLSKPVALILANMMMILNYLFRIKPLITPYAVEIFSNTQKVSIDDAKEILDYVPQVNYSQGIHKIHRWIKEEGIK